MALVRRGCSGIDGRAGSQTDALEGSRPEGGDRHGYQHRFRPAFPTGAHVRQRAWAFRGNGSCHSQKGRRADRPHGWPAGAAPRQLMAATRGRPAPNVAQEAGGAAWAAQGQAIVSEK